MTDKNTRSASGLAAASSGDAPGTPAKSKASPDLDSWRGHLRRFRKDHEFLEQRESLEKKRQGILSPMRSSLASFIEGKTNLGDFKAEYDQKTRTEWDYFGFKGPSGAMFLNTLVLHLPNQEEAREHLQNVLPVPANEADAGSRLSVFQSYLDGQIELGLVDKTQVQPSRGPFFVSGWWHIQSPEEWPIYYFSARSTLRQYAEFRKADDPTADYLEFRRIYLGLAAHLDLSVWQFEHLCAWLDRPAKSPKGGGPTKPSQERRVWLFAPGAQASEWESMYSEGIAAIGWDELGDLQAFEDLEAIRKALALSYRDPDGKNPINSGLACYQFAHELKPGDLILAKRGKREIVGVGTVSSDYRYEPDRPSFRHVRSVNWVKEGAWPVTKDLVTKTLTDIGKYPQLIQAIHTAIPDGGLDVDPTTIPYTIDDADGELFLEKTAIEDLVQLLKGRKNLILQGPPGTGKSFMARRLSWLATGQRDSDRLLGVQFHQSYGYEDFVQGYRPSAGGGFELVEGPFLRFCNQALQDQENDYVLLIDEINRGNLSRIFGELMLLIEPDKRSTEWSTQLTYQTETDSGFHVPPNLLIVGTMNTADRSLALVDYALRRRFAFFDLEPAFSRPKFREHLTQLDVETSLQKRILDRMTSLNQEIRTDPDLGPGYRVGHSYFCGTGTAEACDEAWYTRIVETEIAPLLREYWPEDEERARSAEAALLEEA